tara:strand:+ start:1765 stop:3426 length:1662 start_codon:yes stop_codon:yes gene_type:complete
MSATPHPKRPREGEPDGGPSAKSARAGHHETRVSTVHLPFAVRCVLPGKNGERYVGTNSALYLQVHGRLTLVAGRPGKPGFKDGTLSAAHFKNITGLAMERNGSVLVTDGDNNSIRRVSLTGIVTTLAGNGNRRGGYADGTGQNARFRFPNGIQVHSNGMIYVADSGNQCIRAIHPTTGTVSTLTGTPREPGLVHGMPAFARFNYPTGLALDVYEDLIVTDSGNHCVRKVALPHGLVTMVAGAERGIGSPSAYVDGQGTEARFSFPCGVVVDGSNAIVVADKRNNILRKITGTDAVVTTLAGSRQSGSVDGAVPLARFDDPCGIGMGENGHLLVVEGMCTASSKFRVVDAGLTPTQPCRSVTHDKLQQDYGNLLASGEGADVSFKVGDRVFHAHRVILGARNVYFRGMLSVGREASAMVDTPVLIPDVQPPAFERILTFIYTGECDATALDSQGLTLCDLAHAADYFQATGLYQECLAQFQAQLTVGSVVQEVICARDHGLVEFEQAGLGFLRRHATEFAREALGSLSVFETRPDLIALSLEVTKTLGGNLFG